MNKKEAYAIARARNSIIDELIRHLKQCEENNKRRK